MRPRLPGRLILPLGVAITLLLSGCSGAEEVLDPIELPDPPAAARYLDAVDVSTQVTTLLLGLGQAAGTLTSSEGMFDVTEGGPETLITHYDEHLAGQGWTRADAPTGPDGAPAALWDRGDQHVMIVVVTFQERDLALLLTGTERTGTERT